MDFENNIPEDGTVMSEMDLADDTSNAIVYRQSLTLDYSAFKASHPNMSESDLDTFVQNAINIFKFTKENDAGVPIPDGCAPRQVIQFFEVDGFGPLDAILHGKYDIFYTKRALDFENLQLHVYLELRVYYDINNQNIQDILYIQQPDEEESLEPEEEKDE